jgi:hypothetical protein
MIDGARIVAGNQFTLLAACFTGASRFDERLWGIRQRFENCAETFRQEAMS